MEKNIEQILVEIKNKLAELEAALEAESAARAAAIAVTEVESGVAEAVSGVAEAVSAEPIDIDLDTFPDMPEAAVDLLDDTVTGTEVQPEPEVETESEAAQQSINEAPKQSINDAAQAAKSVNDLSAMPHAWRTDIPGSQVRNILSAISLNDRVLFINTLFQEDPALFQSTIAQFNEMQSLTDAEAYIAEHFPAWNLDSDIAYRFMMAVRRKLQ